MVQHIILLNQVTRIFQSGTTETTALDDIDLAVSGGEFVAIMGPSGCGKSTLLNIVGMIDSPDRGQYRFDGLDVTGMPEEELVKVRRTDLGFVFQNFNLINDLTVYENVELPLLYNDVPRKRRRTQVREVLELVNLDHRAEHKPQVLSGGEQQRVAIARAVVCDPKLILADEPTGNLDSKNGEEVMDMLCVLKLQGATILMVTHSESHAFYADRIVHMLDGKIINPVAEAV